jgi:hypothetical protein
VSVISDYSTTKSKVTNIEVLFKNSNSNTVSKKNIFSKNPENNTFRNIGYYKKYKNNKK